MYILVVLIYGLLPYVGVRRSNKLNHVHKMLLHNLGTLLLQWALPIPLILLCRIAPHQVATTFSDPQNDFSLLLMCPLLNLLLLLLFWKINGNLVVNFIHCHSGCLWLCELISYDMLFLYFLLSGVIGIMLCTKICIFYVNHLIGML